MMNMNNQPPRSRDLASRGRQVINGYYDQYNYARAPQIPPIYPNAAPMDGQAYGYPDPTSQYYKYLESSISFSKHSFVIFFLNLYSMMAPQQLPYPQPTTGISGPFIQNPQTTNPINPIQGQGNIPNSSYPNIQPNYLNNQTQDLNSQQNQLLQKLLQEMNSKDDENIEKENNDLLSKIEQIEKENQRLAQGIDSDDEDNQGPEQNKFVRNKLDIDDQRIISDAVDKALQQYELEKREEEFEYDQLK